MRERRNQGTGLKFLGKPALVTTSIAILASLRMTGWRVCNALNIRRPSNSLRSEIPSEVDDSWGRVACRRWGRSCSGSRLFPVDRSFRRRRRLCRNCRGRGTCGNLFSALALSVLVCGRSSRFFHNGHGTFLPLVRRKSFLAQA